MSLGLGVDTSAYTTSLCLADEAGAALWEWRRLLDVPEGAVGLRQSQAFFTHSSRLVEAILAWRRECGLRPERIVASATPRPQPGSYMPVFTAGANAARALAAAWNVPYAGISHQENHIWAALPDGFDGAGPGAVLHLSGGTTELLTVERNPRPAGEVERWSVALAAATDDLTAGQFIDRVGVALGLPFPAGPALEALAAEAGAAQPLPVAVRAGRLSFSGPESAAQRALAAGVEPAALARGVLACVAASLVKLLDQTAFDPRPAQLLVVGGVAENAVLRAELAAWGRRRGLNVRFAAPERARDQAYGCARAAARWAALDQRQGAGCAPPKRGVEVDA
ncbi:MAG TPA: O-sialoglycoprotein endopeptidase [Limnochordia bacterium]|nr:O-sialoglycoprotein endopeptidase [Limnochordia bacterium]